MDKYIIINQVSTIFILIAIGFIAKKRNLINDQLSKGLSDLVINMALPALIISSFYIDASPDLIVNMGIILACSFVIHLMAIVISKIFFRNYQSEKKKILSYLVIFSNAGFMGLPLIHALYGPLGVFYGSIFMIPYSVIMWTYGLGLFNETDPSMSIKAKIVKMLFNPVIMAVAIGMLIFIFSVNLPYPIHNSLILLGGVTAPLAMIIIGGQLADIRIKDLFLDKDVYYGSFFRLIVLPLLTYGLLTALPIDPLIINISIAIQILPAAVTIVILPQKYGGDTVFASKCALVSHLLSLISIPIMLMLLHVA